jgi:hypothetical protein
MTTRITFDTNVHDAVVADPKLDSLIKESQDRNLIEVWGTYIQGGELADIPDSRNVGQARAVNHIVRTGLFVFFLCPSRAAVQRWGPAMAQPSDWKDGGVCDDRDNWSIDLRYIYRFASGDVGQVPVTRRLLRLRHDRPRRRTCDTRDELAPSHRHCSAPSGQLAPFQLGERHRVIASASRLGSQPAGTLPILGESLLALSYLCMSGAQGGRICR